MRNLRSGELATACGRTSRGSCKSPVGSCACRTFACRIRTAATWNGLRSFDFDIGFGFLFGMFSLVFEFN